MKLAIQYVSDSIGKAQSVLLPLSDLEKLLNKLKKYEQTLKIKTDLKEAYDQVDQIRKSNEVKSIQKSIKK